MEVSFIACLTFAEDRRERLIIRSTLLESINFFFSLGRIACAFLKAQIHSNVESEAMMTRIVDA